MTKCSKASQLGFQVSFLFVCFSAAFLFFNSGYNSEKFVEFFSFEVFLLFYQQLSTFLALTTFSTSNTFSAFNLI